MQLNSAKLDDDVADFKFLMELDSRWTFSHLREIIPDIRAHKIKDGTQGSRFLRFDNLRRNDGCLWNCRRQGRWTDKQFRPHHRLLAAASFLERSMDGRPLSACLVYILFTRYVLDSSRIIAFVRDGAVWLQELWCRFVQMLSILHALHTLRVGAWTAIWQFPAKLAFDHESIVDHLNVTTWQAFDISWYSTGTDRQFPSNSSLRDACGEKLQDLRMRLVVKSDHSH